MFWVILTAALITVGCYWIWDWGYASLFTYLGEAEITPGKWEMCYTYDLMTIPARIVAVLCMLGSTLLCVLTWLFVYDIIFM